MGKEIGLRCPGESWKLLSVVAITFALAVTFQYIELPYATFWPSTSSATKAIVDLEAKGLNDSSPVNSRYNVSSDEAHVPENSSNSSSLQAARDEAAADNGDPEDMTENAGKDFVSQGVGSSDQELVLTNTSSTLVVKNSTADLVLANTSSTLVAKNSTADASVSFAPEESPNNITIPKIAEGNAPSPAASVDSRKPAVHEEANTNQDSKNAKSDKVVQTDISKADANPPSPKKVAEKRRKPDAKTPAVFPISEMNRLMLQSWATPDVIKPRWPSAADEQLRHARSEIEHAPVTAKDPMLYAPIYRNVSMFKRSYELMENMLKVYVYREGERPVFHQPGLRGIYASEGWFMKQMESYKKFVTRDSRKAHLFYLPFGSRNLEEALYVPNSHSHKNLIQYLKDYLDMVSAKHPFWNRTDGADHFLVACHDWAPSETRQYMSNCIRALCNADVKEGFVFGKDSSLPETIIRNPQKPLKDIGGQSASKRSILAFYAGNMHGYVRPILLEHWQNKDPDIKVYGVMPKTKGNKNYIQHMRSSKYCICPKGYEVNSPRVVEAIFHECVPVIISDNFVPPFFEVLNWESFAVFVLEKDIPNLKNILLSISQRRYLQMQLRVKRVQQHFLWHPKPVKYDVFHMILHSIWYNRVFRT